MTFQEGRTCDMNQLLDFRALPISAAVNLALGAALSEWSVIIIVLSGLSLLVGVVLIRRGKRSAHMRAMLVASGLAVIFLVLYLSKIGVGYSKTYVGPQEWRAAYFALLISHTLLAAANVPLALGAVWYAWNGLKAAGNLNNIQAQPARGFFDRHRKWVRWTVPVWLYVAATGWIIWVVLERYGAVKGG